jgi:hypothetical protein
VPSAKGHRDMLKPGLRFFLAHGRLPEPDEDPDVPHGFANGVFEAYLLWGRVIRPCAVTVLDELEHLWLQHEGEIRAAAGRGEPWVEQFLREERAAPTTVEEEPER